MSARDSAESEAIDWFRRSGITVVAMIRAELA